MKRITTSTLASGYIGYRLLQAFLTPFAALAEVIGWIVVIGIVVGVLRVFGGA